MYVHGGALSAEEQLNWVAATYNWIKSAAAVYHIGNCVCWEGQKSEHNIFEKNIVFCWFLLIVICSFAIVVLFALV